MYAYTEKLKWYSHRWKIETFHKVMKSGCQAERSRLGSAERLTNLLCCYCILSWRIFWLTMLSREMPNCNSPRLNRTLHLLPTEVVY
ncbi:transposase [Klebsiella quasipneumoniae subsp. similipneumoniae]|uniref:transposase n=1 Tax=Klebsiella quasipneumoniae TaxID=1463165 RepID=UPI003B85485E